MEIDRPQYRWTKPLTELHIKALRQSNNQNGPMKVIDGPVGPMIRLVCSLNMNPDYHNQVYYCGGDEYVWMREDIFFENYPEFDTNPKMVVDMELDEIHQAEEIMEGMK